MSGRFAGKQVLVVEDEYFIASDLKRALAAEGATVVGPVGRHDEALALASAGDLDAALLDVNLAGQQSFAVAERLAERAVPMMFVTGYDDWSLPETHRDVPRIAKPFAMPAVLDRLFDLIGERNTP